MWSRIHFPNACQDAVIFFLYNFFALRIIILRKHEAIKSILQTHKQLQTRNPQTRPVQFFSRRLPRVRSWSPNTELVQQINPPAEWAACVLGIKSGVKVFYKGISSF